MTMPVRGSLKPTNLIFFNGPYVMLYLTCNNPIVMTQPTVFLLLNKKNLLRFEISYNKANKAGGDSSGFSH